MRALQHAPAQHPSAGCASIAPAQQIGQLEGLAVAIPWGFESPFRTNLRSLRLPPREQRIRAKVVRRSFSVGGSLSLSTRSLTSVSTTRKPSSPRTAQSAGRPAPAQAQPKPNLYDRAAVVIQYGIAVVANDGLVPPVSAATLLENRWQRRRRNTCGERMFARIRCRIQGGPRRTTTARRRPQRSWWQRFRSEPSAWVSRGLGKQTPAIKPAGGRRRPLTTVNDFERLKERRYQFRNRPSSSRKRGQAGSSSSIR